MRGIRSVVTGTLVGAPLAVGDTVELQPSGKTGRIRGLQSFGEVCERVEPGARCAVNIQNVPLEDLSRGLLVTREGAMALTRTFDASWSGLQRHPPWGTNRAPSNCSCGTAERRARVAPIGAADIEAGGIGWARIHIDGEPLALLPEDRFVLRGFHRSGQSGATLGGGRVLDVAPPKRRRSDPALVSDLTRLGGGNTADGLRARVERGGFGGATNAGLALETGLAESAVEKLLGGDDAVLAVGSVWLASQVIEPLAERLVASLSLFHDANPLEPGMPRATLRGALPENVPVAAFESLLDRLVEEGRLESEEKLVRTSDFVPRLTQREEAIAAQLRADAMIAGLEPPTLADWGAEVGVSEADLRPVLGHLERDGSLTRAPGDFWFDKVAVDELREKVLAHLSEHGALATAAYKDLIGTSRKWAVPLMELFDGEHLTMRKGEARVLRRRPGSD